MNKLIEKYLEKRGEKSWALNEEPKRIYDLAVVIPSFCESKNILHTLESLEKCGLTDTIVIVVVNNTLDASEEILKDNLETINLIKAFKEEKNLDSLFFVDASTNPMPAKNGVGLARKIGMDLSLKYIEPDGFILCLDADTTVENNYIDALKEHFQKHSGGVSIKYSHQSSSDQFINRAIKRYERFLKSYKDGLLYAKSPYAFETVGSAMGATALSYVKAFGMNKRVAGEDFYFLQQIYKVAGVKNCTTTVVHPSPRISERVPFGTGRAVFDMYKNGEESLTFYNENFFEILKKFLDLIRDSFNKNEDLILVQAKDIDINLHDYLVSVNFQKFWKQLLLQTTNKSVKEKYFHTWFDAFKTMKLIHHLTDCEK